MFFLRRIKKKYAQGLLFLFFLFIFAAHVFFRSDENIIDNLVFF